jgi:hypothetical protein
MSDPERLATLLENMHAHTGHYTSFARCLHVDCRDLRELLTFERVVWLDDNQPRRNVWAHQSAAGGLTVHGEVPSP